MAPALNALRLWRKKLSNLNIETLFVKKREPGPPRTIFVGQSLPEDYFTPKGKVKPSHVYTSNQVLTSKYTIASFLPRNLFEQFRRIANLFFLFIAILQFFSQFSTISPGLVLFPLLVVLTITAVKDGYEDFKRHNADRVVNQARVLVLSGDEWNNHNVTGPKTRTFVRGLVSKVPWKKRKPEEEKEDSPSPPDTHFDSESTHQMEDSPHWRRTPWEDLKVGDYVKLMEDESVPADLIICSTSDDDNVVFVETKNLDGETNLKSRHAVAPLTSLHSAAACAAATFTVQCDRPESHMHRLNGAVKTTEGTRFPVDLNMTLLRGTVVRNTRWVIGLVVFTGEDTKVILNSGGTPSKRSNVERQMNPQVLVNLSILALMAIACGITDSVLEHRLYPMGAPWLYGANTSDDNPSINGLITAVFALITFQNVVPISLYVTVEVVRLAQAAWIYLDLDMYDQRTDTPALARNFGVLEDLGQIEYIFSDKTGTLTQNAMVFRGCSAGGVMYQEDEETAASTHSHTNSQASPAQSSERRPFRSRSLQSDLAKPSDNSQVDIFFTVLSLCHTVLANEDPATRKVTYKGASPDESALVQSAADVGYVFIGRDREVLSIRKNRLDSSTDGTVEQYELLNVLEFNSARKRMSVVLKKLGEDGGQILLLCKGADNVIFDRLQKGQDELKKTTEAHLTDFANGGLRTLTLGYKVVSNGDYAAWNERYHEATVAMENRDELVDAVSDELEQDLILLGATAIEDSLQDDVPETISALKRAGIRIWVLTGDKLETAVAIGQSTNLIARESNILVVRGNSLRTVSQQLHDSLEKYFPDAPLPQEDGALKGYSRRPSSRHSRSGSHPGLRRVDTNLSLVGRGNGSRPGGFVLVIDGAGLDDALADDVKPVFLQLSMLCEAVICCRVSPLQKALAVKLVKTQGVTTLAIGDGANDCSMIQEASVGVGISGEEGLQAVNSSDYAIAQFSFLKKLLLVHGHFSYHRNGTLIWNFFYKNIVCIGVLWWFQIYDGWSSTYAFEYTVADTVRSLAYLLLFNAFWTLTAVVAIGLFDRVVDSRVLMAWPELYKYSREGKWFGIRIFTLGMIDGIYQSAIIFFIITYAYGAPTVRSDGFQQYIYEFSTTMVLCVVIVANLFNGLHTSAWTGWSFFLIFIGIVLVWVFTAVFNTISPGWIVTMTYGNNHFLFRSAIFWLCLPIVVVLSLLPRYLYKALEFGFFPSDLDIMRYQIKMHPDRILTPSSPDTPRSPTSPHRVPLKLWHSTSRVDMATGLRTLHRGFNFSAEEGGVALSRLQSNLSDRERTTKSRKGRISNALSLPRSFFRTER